VKRISSEHFEHAVNQVLLSDTVADAVKKNIITPEGSRPRDWTGGIGSFEGRTELLNTIPTDYVMARILRH